MRTPLVTLLSLALLAQPLAAQQRDTTKKDPTDELPLKATRSTSFTTDEGTWVSLDVSPDGRTIAFDLAGDIYTIPVAGGKATRLTSGMAFDGQPRYSPDGKTIAFVSDRSGAENLWLMDADGSHVRALSKGDKSQYLSPEWTPDGQYLVVSRTGSGVLASTYDLTLYHRDGGTGVRLTGAGTQPAAAQPAGGGAPPFDNYLGAAFGPDGRYVYAAAKRGGFGYNQMIFAANNMWQLVVYDRETGKTFTRSAAVGGGMRPAISPDGQWLAYATRGDTSTTLKLREISTGDEQTMLVAVQRDDAESRFTRDLLPGYSWMPDGKSLVIAHHGKIWRLDVTSRRETMIPFTADVTIDMGPPLRFAYSAFDSTLTVRQIRGATPSPDGKRLAFTALDKLYLMDLPNGTPRRLTSSTAGEHSPVWSPDGRYLAYITWTEAGGDVWRVRTDGGRTGTPEKLSRESAFYEKLAYDPTGRRLVMARGPRQQRLDHEDEIEGGEAEVTELVWMPADGGPTTMISPLNNYGQPHFTRDSSRIFVYDQGEGLVSMRWDGTDRKAHVRVTGFLAPGGGPNTRPRQARDIIASPDGSRALADVDNRLFIVTIPVSGGQTPSISVNNPAQAPVPVKRVTRVGGEFPGWKDNMNLYYSLGRSFFMYNTSVADSLVRDSTQRADSLKRARGQGARPDSSALAGGDSTRRARHAYEPQRVDVTVTVQRDKPSGTVVLHGARIVSMNGNEVIPNGDIVVRDNRIVAVGAAGSVALPAGAKTIDVTGKTILPGYVDVHAHMWPLWGVHRTEVFQYLVNLAYGVTTTRDPQTSTTDVLSYGDLVETGDMLGPRIYSTGPGVFAWDDITSLDDAREVMRRYSEFYHTNTIKQYMAGDRKVRQWIVMAAREQGIMPTLEGGLDFKKNFTEAIDGYSGSEHSYPITPLFKDVINPLAYSGVTYTPTLLVQYGGPWAENYWYEHYDIHSDAKLARFTPHHELDRRALRRPQWFRDDQYSTFRVAEGAAKLVAAGGKVGLGSHGQLQGLGAQWEIWSMAMGGMPNQDVLKVATIFGAQSIGMEKDIGSIEVGKLADLQVLDANPLDNIRNTNTIRYVMKNGRLYDANTLSEIWPRQRDLPRQSWQQRQAAAGGSDK